MLPFVKLKYIQFQKFVGEHLNTGNKQINKTLYWSVGIIHDKLALAYDMGSFFIKKILDLQLFIVMYSSYCSMSFTTFRRVDMDYLRKLVLRAPTKSCLLDPVPTNIMKDCLDELLSILSTMINLSLESGFFRDIRKDAVVTPLLKRNKVLT